MYKIYLTDHFLKQLKPLTKKFRNLEDDIVGTLENFILEQADRLGQKFYKVRLKSNDLPRGKNKSFRIIIFLIGENSVIAPITVYFKGDQENIDEKEIEYHLEMVLLEIEK